jgi:hypothetical protein
VTEKTVLYAGSDSMLASAVLEALFAQRHVYSWTWLHLHMESQHEIVTPEYGKPQRSTVAFEVSTTFAGVGEPQADPGEDYERQILKAIAFVQGYLAGRAAR